MIGRFVWYEYLATDAEAAIAFYTEVLGWKTERFADSPASSPYRMWVSGQGPLGGLMELPDAAKAAGTPPHWMGHVGVDDIEATVAKVEQLGGTVHIPPTAIPNVGRFSMIADPQSATLSVFQPDPTEAPMPPRDPSGHGEIMWSELHTPDPSAALAFYGELFGWTRVEELDMGTAKYTTFGEGSEAIGGVMKRPADAPTRPMWVYYVNVDDLDAAVARATSSGAAVLHGPAEIPGGARIAQLTDPRGGLFALHGLG